jgi:hypothetical protein
MTLLTAQHTRQKCVVMVRCLEYGFVENGWFCLRGKEELCKKKARFFAWGANRLLRAVIRQSYFAENIVELMLLFMVALGFPGPGFNQNIE